MNQPENSLRSGLSWVFSTSIIVGCINFFAQLLFARELGVKILSDYAVIVVAIELFSVMLDFGFNQSIIKYPEDKSIQNCVLFLIYVQCFLMLLFLAAGILFFWDWSGLECGLLIPALMVTLSRFIGLLTTYLYAPLEAKLRYRAITISRMVSTIMALIVALVVLVQVQSIYVLVVRDLVLGVLFLIFVQFSARSRIIPKYDRKAFKIIWNFNRHVWALNVLQRITVRLDYAFVGILLGKEALGIYFTVRRILEGLLNFITSPIQTVMFAFYSRFRNDARRISKYLITLVLPYTLFFAIPALLTLFFGKDLVGKVLSEQWRSGGMFIPGLIVYCGAIVWFENIKSMALAIDLQKFAVQGRIVQLATLSLCMYPLYVIWGYYGIGLATGLSATALGFYSTYRFTRRIKFVETTELH